MEYYLITAVFIFVFLILILISCEKNIVHNGWVNETDIYDFKDSKNLITFLIKLATISFIPIIRIFILISVIMCVCTNKEDWYV